jgi:ribosomal protein S18 acetylase RimI-like enzyme
VSHTTGHGRERTDRRGWDPEFCEDRAVTTRVDVQWPTGWTDDLAERSHELIHAVSELGGAIGWMSPPSRAETDRWLDGVLRAAAAGDAAMCIAMVDGRLAAMGLWRRDQAPYFRHLAEVARVMVHPRTRGLGLGRAVTEALIGGATTAGIETLHLGVRGNNHRAIELYEGLGFREWGRLSNVIEVGDERFDDVRMFLELERPAHLVLHGGSAVGPGSSPSRRSRPGAAGGDPTS